MAGVTPNGHIQNTNKSEASSREPAARYGEVSSGVLFRQLSEHMALHHHAEHLHHTVVERTAFAAFLEMSCDSRLLQISDVLELLHTS
jgi:hypothetical protein